MTHIYHITYAPATKTVCLYFGGCNFSCRGCVRKKDIQDIHLGEGFSCYLPTKEQLPTRFLGLKGLVDRLRAVEVKQFLFMGGEPTIDPELPGLAKSTHEEFQAYNVLLTNGFILPSLKDFDEVQLSLKAYTESLHQDFTGKSNRKVLENFVNLHQAGVKLKSESILIPNYIDYQEIEKIARFIASVSSDIPYRIDSYIPVPEEPWRRPTSREIEKAVDVARKYLRNVSCLKGDESLRYKIMKLV